MAEMWEISRFVEENPDDYNQRWRLVKKLYAAWEYRLALEHLQILKKEWEPRLNVRRYLAATLYRLGRYDEAIDELEHALETWPKETGLLEQLARVYEVAGNPGGALATWKAITASDPGHPVAAGAVQRLQEGRSNTDEEELKIGESDSGIDLSPGQICPSCGAQNSDEFNHCWQCQTKLLPTPVEQSFRKKTVHDKQPRLTYETATMATGISMIAFVAFGLYLTLITLWHEFTVDHTLDVPTNLWELYSGELVFTRLIAGAVLMLSWPFVLLGTLRLIQKDAVVPTSLALFLGLFLAALTYVSTWLPVHLLFFSVIQAPILLIILLMSIFRTGFLRAIILCVLNLAMLGLIVGITITITESVTLNRFYNPFQEIPAIIAYQSDYGAEVNNTITIADKPAPIELQVIWDSTGSNWLDHRAQSVKVIITSERHGPDTALLLQREQEDEPAVFQITEYPFNLVTDVVPGEFFTFRLQAPERTQASIQINGFLPMRLIE